MASPNDSQPLLVALWRRIVESPMTPRVAVATASFLLVLAVTANYLAHPRSKALEVGDVARADYVAAYFAMYEDTAATEAAREAAASEVEPVYSINNAVNADITSDLAGFFLVMSEQAGRLRYEDRDATVESEEPDPAEEELEADEIGEAGSAEEAESAAIETLRRALDEARKIQRYFVEPVSDEDFRKLLSTDQEVRDRLREVVDRSIRERIISIIHEDELSEALDDLRETVLSKAGETELTSDEGRLAALIAGYFMRPNAMLDLAATQQARQQARDATPPVQKQVRGGEIFLRAGEVATQEDLDILLALGMLVGSRDRQVWVGIALFAIVLGCAFVLGTLFLAAPGTPRLYDLRYYVLFYAILTIAYLSSFFLIQRLSQISEGSPGVLLLTLASLPVVAAAVLFAHYFTRMLAAIVSGFLAVVVTLAAGEPAILLPAIFPSLAASLLIKRDCPRPQMIRAIILLPLIWAVAILAQAHTAGFDLSLFVNPWFLLAGVAPAPVAMILANFVLDSAFNIPTANRLREFDTPDHPLLRKLQLEAPGTWHHSMMVGLIAEAACQTLGGNILLVRVACMYHDIGKLRRPEFFIENQRGTVNVHEKYSPWLSKLIVENHVKDGVSLAQAHGLPEELIDMIPEHHGTSLITYFFRKALAMSENGFVNEYDYRYPGPKPQSLEAACINLADACESATRALEDPTPHRIENLVQRIYEERLLDGQYDECGLALNQLETVKTTIIDRLVNAYHARIDYPEEEELRRQLQLKRAEGDKTSSRIEPLPDQEE